LPPPPAPWRSGYAAACKAVYTGSIPVGAFAIGAESPLTPGGLARVRDTPGEVAEAERSEREREIYEALGLTPKSRLALNIDAQRGFDLARYWAEQDDA
jgi:hypothetical protein